MQKSEGRKAIEADATVCHTHLHGPHQSVCWLRPKRALHFLGEPGSEYRNMRREEAEAHKKKERKDATRSSHLNLKIQTNKCKCLKRQKNKNTTFTVIQTFPWKSRDDKYHLLTFAFCLYKEGGLCHITPTDS